MPNLRKELFYFQKERKRYIAAIEATSCKEESLKRGLRVGRKIKVGKPRYTEWGKVYEIKDSEGIVTGLYPHLFTVELQGKKIVRTSFMYFQVLNKEVELC